MSRIIIFLLALSLLTIQTASAQKVTQDPNTGPSELSGAGDGDARLAQKVTYEAWHKPVKAILEDISKKTGVTLFSGYNKNDWQVRDRRMNVFVRDVTLAELMNSISRVMRFKWSTCTDVKPPTYRLYANRKAIADMQRIASKKRDALVAERTRRRVKLLDTFEKLAKASDADIAKLKDTNPYLYMSAQTGFIKAAVAIFDELPEMRESFIQASKNYNPPVNKLSKATEQLYLDAMRSRWRYDHLYRKGDLPDDMDEKVTSICRVFFEHVPHPDDADQLYDFGGFATMIYGSVYVGTGKFRDPDCKGDQAWCKALLKAEGDKRPLSDVCKEMSPEMDAGYKSDKKNALEYLVLDPVTEHADGPDVHKKAVLRKKYDELVKALPAADSDSVATRRKRECAQKAMALSYGLNVVSDSFTWPGEGEPFEPEDGEQELGHVLDTFGERAVYNWEKHAAVLEFRRRDWFDRRDSQVPEEWLDRWRADLIKTGTMTLDQYGEMLQLDTEQARENIHPDPLLNKAFSAQWDAENNRGLMRVYLRLSESQQAMMFTKEGLDPRTLGSELWRCYTEMLHYGYRMAWDTEALADLDAPLMRIRVTNPPPYDVRTVYQFNVVVGNIVNGTEDWTAQSVWDVQPPKIPEEFIKQYLEQQSQADH